MGASELAATASAAAEAASADPAKAISLYREVVFGAGSDGESIKVKESSIDALAKLLASAGDAEALRALLAELRPLFKVVPKAKTAKIVRNVIDILSTVKGHDDLQVELCKEQVAWAREEKRTFLRHRVELRLSALYLEMRAYQDALKLIGSLAFEVKKLDDKLLLVDIHLLESKIHYALRNMPKVTTRPALRPRAVTQPRSRDARRLNGSAPVQHVPWLRGRALFFFRSFLRSGFVPLTSSLPPPAVPSLLPSQAKAALTAARTNSNAIYVPPSVQCVIDSQSGILHAEEKDYKTAYSYFFEAFEQLNNLDETERAATALKYMLMCKVMCGQADEVAGLISSKGGAKHQGEALDAMRAVAAAYAERSLQRLRASLGEYKAQLEDDPIIDAHLGALKDSLMEQNLLRVIEPFSRVEISHVAKLIELPLAEVETKLSQMILDGKFEGILDQGAGCLIVYDDQAPNTVYKATLETVANMDRVVDSLMAKSGKIAA